MQLSFSFIVCSFGIASTATTTSATSASVTTKLLIVAAWSAAILVADCVVHCCSPSTGWSSVEGSRLRFWQLIGEPTSITIVASSIASFAAPDTTVKKAAVGYSFAE